MRVSPAAETARPGATYANAPSTTSIRSANAPLVLVTRPQKFAADRRVNNLQRQPPTRTKLAAFCNVYYVACAEFRTNTPLHSKDFHFLTNRRQFLVRH